MKKYIKNIIIAIIASLLLSYLVISALPARMFISQITISFDIKTQREIDLQMFYTTESGESFQEVKSLHVLASSSDDFKEIKFVLPSQHLDHFRLDFGNSPGTCQIKNLAIHKGDTVCNIKADTILNEFGYNQIDDKKLINDDVVEMSTENSDPYIFTKTNDMFFDKLSHVKDSISRPTAFALAFSIIFAIFLVIIVLVNKYPERYSNYKRKINMIKAWIHSKINKVSRKPMFMIGTNTIIAVITSLLLSYALICSLPVRMFTSPLTLSFEIKAQKDIGIQLFYITKSGGTFQEVNSIQTTVPSSDEFKEVKFKLPFQDLDNIRMDFGNFPGTYQIKNFVIHKGDTVCNIQADTIINEFAYNQIDNKKLIDGNIVEMSAESADPYIYPKNNNIFVDQLSHAKVNSSRPTAFVITFSILTALFLLVLFETKKFLKEDLIIIWMRKLRAKFVKFSKNLKQYSKHPNTIRSLVSIFAVVVLSVIVELMISHVIKGKPFNLFEFIFILILGLLCLVFVFGNKLFESKPEKIFLVISLLVGSMLVVTLPITQLTTWDRDTHHTRAVVMSYFGDAAYTNADTAVDNFWYANKMGNPFYIDINMYKQSIKEIDGLNVYKAATLIPKNYATIISNIAYIPSSIMIALGRMLSLPYVLIFIMGRLGNLFVFTLLMYYAIKF